MGGIYALALPGHRPSKQEEAMIKRALVFLAVPALDLFHTGTTHEYQAPMETAVYLGSVAIDARSVRNAETT